MESSDSSPRVRLLAVMAADAAGYSRLMSLDDHGTVAALDAAREVFRAEIGLHGGRVIDMAGDSVLAVFDNATAAVKSALSIQRRLGACLAHGIPEQRWMRFRIGIHLGDVIEKVDGSVYGDGVNIAARLQALAEPGGVTASEAVRITVKGRVDADFDDQGEQRVKNIAEPLRAFRLLPPSGRPVSQDLALASKSLDEHPRIAVLPFTTTGSDGGPEATCFADGLVDDLIGSLAAVRGLLVIARSSAFTYKGRSIDARTVGQELGVRYVVEGSCASWPSVCASTCA